jgi:starch phosphorylase
MTQSYEATDASRVLTMEEITNLTEEGSKPADTLMNVVALIATRFRTDVCSAYLLEPDRSNLVLAATLGLHPRCIGTLRMPINEGLSGLVAEQVLPVAVEDVSKHPRFKYFKESGEEVYHSFLGVPLVDRGILQGVLVVQTKNPRKFREEEIRMLGEAASQVAPVVSEARTLDRFIAPAQERLWSVAHNLSWCWDYDCISLFRDLNPTRWSQLNQNPIALLNEIPLGELERRATELGLHSRINSVYRQVSSAPGPSPIFLLNSACTSPCPFIPVAWACLPGTTSRAPPISAFPSSASACFTARATSANTWTRRAGNGKSTSAPTSINFPWSSPSARRANRSS